MRLYARADGTLVASNDRINPGDPVTLIGPGFPEAPTVPAATLDVDTETNAALVADVVANAAAYRLAAGVLTKNGAAVTINAPGRAVRDREFAMEKLAELEADRDLTINQIGRVLRFILRWIVRHG
jgi:hypothetical protein